MQCIGVCMHFCSAFFSKAKNIMVLIFTFLLVWFTFKLFEVSVHISRGSNEYVVPIGTFIGELDGGGISYLRRFPLSIFLPHHKSHCRIYPLGGSKNTNFQNSMGALSNPISFAIRISKQFLFSF